MKVAFRIDDVSPYMNWPNFIKLAAIFDEYGIQPLMGVIPDNRDPELTKYSYRPQGWGELSALKNRGWLVAQHGFRHLYTMKDSGILQINPYSEFAGISLSQQMDMLAEGRTLLEQEGLKTDIFMAPAHSYDDHTLTALKQLGFHYVTDGYSLFPYCKSGLKFIPCQSSTPKKGLPGILTVCLHPNEMTDDEFIQLEQWIKANRQNACNYQAALQYPSCGFIARASEQLILALRKKRKQPAEDLNR